MSATLLLVMFFLALIAAIFTSAGHPGRFAFLLIGYSFIVSVVYWTFLAGVVFASH